MGFLLPGSRSRQDDVDWPTDERGAPRKGKKLMSRIKEWFRMVVSMVAVVSGFVLVVVLVSYLVNRYEESKKYNGKTMEQWGAALESDSTRTEAIEALGHFGPEGK